MATLSVMHEYFGLVDYWSGTGRRWDDNAGCLFAYYNADTTLRDCVNQWVDDYNSGGDCDSFPEDITSDDILAAILDSLTDEGRDDYHSGALAECAVEYAKANGKSCPYCNDICNDEHGCDGYMGDPDNLLNRCTECDEPIESRHTGGCGKRIVDCEFVVADDCVEDDDDGESPVWILLIEIETQTI